MVCQLFACEIPDIVQCGNESRMGWGPGLGRDGSP